MAAANSDIHGASPFRNNSCFVFTLSARVLAGSIPKRKAGRSCDGDLVLLPQGIAHRLASAPDVVGDSLKGCQVTKVGEQRLRRGAGRNGRYQHPFLRLHGFGRLCA
jgi:hypothetical protein